MTGLSGRSAVVTGAASGIGAAIVARLRAEGARVAGIDLREAIGSDHDIVADLRDGAALKSGLAGARAAIGVPTILVHAAAASHFGGCFDTDPATFVDLFDVNVAGAVRVMQACVPDMRAAGGGAMVMLTSVNARFATPSLAAYATTKAALENLVQTAALELAGDAIRVNAIAPASVDTPAMRASYARADDPEEA
ncbi:MAG TPA: SDR family oxidoreductase, partial [Sphingomonas sp.]|nr:SDR family oxidoreductase [Sphingomonas sp.]